MYLTVWDALTFTSSPSHPVLPSLSMVCKACLVIIGFLTSKGHRVICSTARVT